MARIFFTSDLHLGLKTEGVSRDAEIYSILDDVIEECRAQSAILVLGGDIFNHNSPSEEEIKAFIDNFLNKLEGITTFIMVGNHDVIHSPENTSCLSFIPSVVKNYPSSFKIRLIDDVSSVKIEANTYITFLPYMTKSTLISLGKEKYEPQEYINQKSKLIFDKLPDHFNHIVFSHLNVKGAKAGSEESLLKKAMVYLPPCFTEQVSEAKRLPKIIQGHLHSKDLINNIHIVGSPLYCGFGEVEKEKYYAYISIENGKEKIIYQPTNCVKFHQLELVIDENSDPDFFNIPEVYDFCKTITKTSIVKFDVKLYQGTRVYNFDLIKESVEEKYSCVCKPIIPKIIATKVSRNTEQKINLKPDEAVKVFIKSNINDKERAKRIWSKAKEILQ